jgi:hypothetical protein
LGRILVGLSDHLIERGALHPTPEQDFLVVPKILAEYDFAQRIDAIEVVNAVKRHISGCDDVITLYEVSDYAL